MGRPIVWTPRAHRLADAAGLVAVVIFGALLGLVLALWVTQ